MRKTAYDTANEAVMAAFERREDALTAFLDHHVQHHEPCEFAEALADATCDYYDVLDTWAPLADERGAPEGVVLQ